MKTEIEVIEKEKEPVRADVEYYGACPKCKHKGFLHGVMNETFVVCDKCKTWWDSRVHDHEQWRYEDANVWLKQVNKLNEYNKVVPYRPEPPEPDREQVVIKVHYGSSELVFKCKCIQNDCEWWVHNECRIRLGLEQIEDQFFKTIGKIMPQYPTCEISHTQAEHIPEDDFPF